MKQEESRGRKNWNKLKNILLSGTINSKRNKMKFNLFQKHSTHLNTHILTTYTLEQYSFVQTTPQPIYKELLHFQSQVDATGRWVWEAEEIGAYFFIHSGEILLNEIGNEKSASILQLGGGSSGLAGIALSSVAVRKGLKVSLELTDGEQDNIQYLAANLKDNMGESCTYKASRLLWGEADCVANFSLPAQQRKTFNFIVLCDCLYFANFHKELVITIDSYLKKEGTAFLINPARGNSMALFLSIAEEAGFVYEFMKLDSEKFMSELSKVKEYKDFVEDKHFPYFIRLRRSTT